MNRQLATVAAVLFIIFVGFGIIIPVMPELVASAYHLSWMLAVYSLASFVMSPVWGGISDRVGRRPVLMLGLTGFAFSFVLFGLAEDKLWLMYVSRVLGGLFSGATTSCAVAYIADITPEERRTKSMGLVGMSIGLGFVFGPAIGGLLSMYGLTVPFFAASVLVIVTLLIAAFRLPESLPPDRRKDAGSRRVSRWSAFAGPLRPLYLLSFIVSFSLAGLEATIFYFLEVRIRTTSVEMGVILTISGLVGALVQGGVVRRFVKKGDEPKVISLGLVLSAAGFFLLLGTGRFWTAVTFMCVFGIGNALVRPCVLSLITLKAKVGQGVATGLSSSMDSLGRIVGPLAGGYLYLLHADLPYAVSGVVSLLSLLLVAGFLRADRKSARTAK